MEKFIPTVWSARTLAHLDKELVYGDVVNTEYEGEIRNQGDTVKINQVGPITISDYKGTLEAPEDLKANQSILKIDKAKAFNFGVDDVLAAQSNLNLVDEATRRAGYGLADVVDQDIASQVTKAKIKVGTAGTPVELTPKNIYDQIVELSVKLSEANVPKEGRFLILPPAALGLLTRDFRFTRDEKVLENGAVSVGRVAGFDIRESNNVPFAAGKYSIMAGSDKAVAFAGQITKVEQYRPENSFKDAVKGLYVYGVEVIQPEALAHMTATVVTEEQVDEKEGE